jgi:hypothetical protein
MRFFGAGIYYISILYIMANRIIALYICLIRAKIILYIKTVILINAAIYRFILSLIILIYISHFNFKFNQISKILISIFDIIKVFENVKDFYFIRTSRLHFREK